MIPHLSRSRSRRPCSSVSTMLARECVGTYTHSRNLRSG